MNPNQSSAIDSSPMDLAAISNQILKEQKWFYLCLGICHLGAWNQYLIFIQTRNIVHAELKHLLYE